MPKEAKARIKINKLLEESGWRFFDGPDVRANIRLEANVKLTGHTLNELGEDFEKTKKGFIDFLLLDENSFPLAVLEAKREEKNPLDGKEQARKYAQSENVRFVILSNGNLHYFWDIETGNPYIITSFPNYQSLVHRHSFKPNPGNLIKETIETDYIAVTQKPDYQSDPRWFNESMRAEFLTDTGLRFLRDYQLRAVRALQDAVNEGRDRFLFEMATGTGKTLVAAAVIKLFLRTGNAKRVLFLVDRLELEDQARKNMVRYLKNDYKCVIYKENREDWTRAEIVISTVQSLLFKNKYKDIFSPTDFDLVISDEAHRSIGGNSRAVFEYFTGFKLGLTATPKDYLKNVDEMKLSERDPRKLERRQLLDTYLTFGCEKGEPTFRYSLLDGVSDEYLVNPIVADARTDITTELLSEEGYSILVEDENGELQEKTYFQKDFEKKLFSEETNWTICKTFIEKALRDPLTGEIGKSIIFCVSQNHASKIAQILNELAHKYFPAKYKSDFAIQITSNIADSQQMTINFANNNLNGHTSFKDGYISSRTRVCVTVGMMTTGYDSEDILNLCLVRPIFSPTDFIQMKGRGTRRYTFVYKEKNELSQIEEYKKEKERFKLFDFFANCEYFEEKFNYDEVIELPPSGGGIGGGDGTTVAKEYENISPDPLQTIAEIPIGLEGMKIDRKLFEKFEEVLKSDDYVKDKIYEGKYEEAEAYVKREVFDKPEEYFNLDKLRKSVKLDRRLSLREILDKIFGKIKRFKAKDELLEEEIQKFISIYHPEPKFIHIIGQFMKAYILDENIRRVMESGEFSELATNPRFNMRDLKELDGWRNPVIEYVKDYVSLNAFL
ncbi:MAG: deoxyribonuclease [Candidatus Scalindua rubra]|uniref:Deoxyribonuclease n=1 Tax=Candidatus Scalindua rubra TaxID=1872076 RepID=A0A1E3X9W4_9BACT|nr:MAG: deoxyribonuclease [Candidatus Scalindua rubra]